MGALLGPLLSALTQVLVPVLQKAIVYLEANMEKLLAYYKGRSDQKARDQIARLSAEQEALQDVATALGRLRESRRAHGDDWLRRGGGG